MSKKDKEKKKRKVRTPAERLADAKRKVAEMEAKHAFNGLKTAVKDGCVAEGDQPEYRKLLRAMKVMEKAPSVFSDFDLEEEAAAAAKLRDKLIGKLKKLVTESADSPDDEDEEASEDEEEIDEDEESDDDEDEESDDDDDDEDEESDDFDDDDDDDD